jgi:hypothetical protein
VTSGTSPPWRVLGGGFEKSPAQNLLSAFMTGVALTIGWEAEASAV